MTGAELRTARKHAGLTQAELAKRAGVARETVQYWERQLQLSLCSGAPAAFSKVLGLIENVGFVEQNARKGRGGFSFHAYELAYIARQAERQAKSKTQILACRRVICGAKTRKGAKCRNKSEPGKCRCKFHGGKSTGPRTPEGKARIAEAQRRRWALVKELALKSAANS